MGEHENIVMSKHRLLDLQDENDLDLSTLHRLNWRPQQKIQVQHCVLQQLKLG